MNYKLKFSAILFLSILITFLVGITKKSYSTYKYVIVYSSELNKFINVLDVVPNKIQNKKHIIYNIISRNTREGKIEILKSFNEDKIIKNQTDYFNKLKNDLSQINIDVFNFLTELEYVSRQNIKTVDENYKRLRLQELIKNKSFFKVNNVSIKKTKV